LSISVRLRNLIRGDLGPTWAGEPLNNNNNNNNNNGGAAEDCLIFLADIIIKYEELASPEPPKCASRILVTTGHIFLWLVLRRCLYLRVAYRAMTGE
jgi:hypothetical protein